ncbi:MAG: sensor histidine kinase [Fusicatenibacter sp.]|nr:sensor histidine kinase [Fusicatenibacter sp.]
MREKLLLRFNNLSFRNKITAICILISLIPMLLLGILSYRQISHQLITSQENSMNETLGQIADSIDYKLNNYMNALNIVLWDETIKTSLGKTYETNYDLYMFYKDTIDSLFLNIRSLNKDIESVSLYTDANVYAHTPYVYALDSAIDLPWYEQALSTTAPFYQISDDGQKLYLVCQMYYKYPVITTIVCITVETRVLFESVQSLTNGSYGFLMTDSGQNLIYETASFSEDSIYHAIPADAIIRNDVPSEYVATQYMLDDANWMAYLYRPLNELRTSFRQFQILAVGIALLCVLISCLVASFLSRIVAQPLEKLSGEIRMVEKGNYSIASCDPGRTDEIGQLQHSFQAMVTQLNYLINEVLVAQIKQQKYGLRILQSQINPHFLYNSLSLISGQAIMAGQDGISQMAQLLSTFYRTMLNKGKAMTSIRDELENTKAYVSIQQIMHSYSFDVTYDIDERCLSFSILNLVIQPLAENAILHGLDRKQSPGKGILTISCRLENDDIVFKVIDNGCGMSAEECSSILTAESRGYGVKNVHQRVLLYYGDHYGLTYRSTPGCGTCAALRLPGEKECS